QHPAHVCNKWFGHTEKVAQANYRMLLDRHFSKAAGLPVDNQCPSECPSELVADSSSDEQGSGKPQEKPRAVARSAHPNAAKRPRQESNLVYDLRKVACEFRHTPRTCSEVRDQKLDRSYATYRPHRISDL